MAVIQRLSHDVIDVIKAGEIIERPASVVKELFENAVDAGATDIIIELIDGGKSLIKVQDNGSGIEAHQVPLALERHATSKLRAPEDLLEMSTFGFRGEALASIAAISKLTLRSRTEQAELGEFVSFEMAKEVEHKQEAMPVGTCLAIRDLFYNIPVRQKFLKTTSTEFAHVQDYLLAMCLAYPQLSLRLIHNGRDSFRYPGCSDLKTRFSLMHREIAEDFIPFRYERNGISVEGFVGKAETARPNPKMFLTFVNGRLVKDRILRAGLLQAYSGLVLKGMVPSGVLFVNVPPASVDVNAHPAKTEIRFVDPMLVQDFVTIAVQNAVKNAATAAFIGGKEAGEGASEGAVGGAGEGVRSFSRQELPARNPPVQNAATRVGASYFAKENLAQESIERQSSKLNVPAGTFSVANRAPHREQEILQPERSNGFESEIISANCGGVFAGSVYLGQYSNCYLLFESKEDLLVVDQHAFHERVLFEELLATAEKKATISRQQLLAPLLLPFPRAAFASLEDFLPDLEKLGFEVECLTDGQLAVHSCPTLVSVSRLAETMEELLARVLSLAELPSNDAHPLLVKARAVAGEFLLTEPAERSLTTASVYHRIFATIACHSAVRAGDPLNPELVRRLTLRSGDVDFFAHCPHGRPVYKRWSKREVGQWFFRI